MSTKAIWGAPYRLWFPRKCWACGMWTRHGRALLLDGVLESGFRVFHHFVKLLPLCDRCGRC